MTRLLKEQRNYMSKALLLKVLVMSSPNSRRARMEGCLKQ